MGNLSFVILPFLVLGIIIYGYHKRVNIYDEFLIGAEKGAITTYKVIPNLFAMIFAINILIKSNIIHDVFQFLEIFLNQYALTADIIPMLFLRSVSGSSTFAIMSNIFALYGPDSLMGLLASTIQGSSDTTFYVIALYYGSIGITKNRYALPVGLFADLCGIIAAFIIVFLLFY